MTIKVLQVITDTNRRGAQTFAVDLHHAMEALQVQVKTLALVRGSSGEDGFDLPVLGTSRMGVATLRALRREVRSASVVVGHGSTTLFAGALASIGTGVPFVYRQISDVVFWTPTLARRLRVRLALWVAARIVALWDGSAIAVAQRFGVPNRKIVVIPNGVVGAGYTPVPPRQRRVGRRQFGLEAERPTALCVAALVPEKGVDLVIDAVGRLPDVQLLIVGDGPERSSLQERADRSAPARVRFAGWLPNVVPAYGVADVVVLASRGGDSMPATLIEAGLMGLPVVSTPVEAIPEIVQDGVTGRIVAAEAEPVSAALGQLLERPEESAAMGTAARRRCLARYEISAVADRWVEALDEVGRILRRH